MAWEQVSEAHEWAQNAGADLSEKLHYIARMGSDGDIELGAAASDKLLGVIRETNVADHPVTVQFGGVGKVIAGGTVTPGDLITSDGNGKGIATTSSGNRIIGIAMTAADSNDIFSVMLSPGSV